MKNSWIDIQNDNRMYFRTAPSPKRNRQSPSQSPALQKLNLDQSVKTEDDVFEVSQSKITTPPSKTDQKSNITTPETKSEKVKDDRELEHEEIPLSPKSTESQNRESEGEGDAKDEESRDQATEENEFISVHKKGEIIKSWMCKTCNCIFLDQVSFHHFFSIIHQTVIQIRLKSRPFISNSILA